MQHRTRRHGSALALLTDPEDDQVITRLDYFAARAPREIPDWFRPDPPAYDGPAFPDIPKDIPDDDRKTLESWVRDPCFDLDDQYAEFQDAAELHWTARKLYKEECEWDRYYQWPWTWAECMLIMRDTYMQEEPQ
jgi:hypothetical protein